MGIRRFSYNFPKIYSKTRVGALESPAMSGLVHVSEQAKRSLRKPAIAKQTKLLTLIKQNQTS